MEEAQSQCFSFLRTSHNLTTVVVIASAVRTVVTGNKGSADKASRLGTFMHSPGSAVIVEVSAVSVTSSPVTVVVPFYQSAVASKKDSKATDLDLQ